MAMAFEKYHCCLLMIIAIISTVGIVDASLDLSGESLHKFEQNFLKHNNELRAKHGAPPLKLSRQLCDFAHEWAKKIASEHKLRHRPDNKYGENIYELIGARSAPNGAEPVKSWYNEIKHYEKQWYGHEPDMKHFESFGHFTQLVWKASHSVGVGYAANGNTIMVVANYDPRGNVIGSFKNNVHAPK